MTGEPKLLTEAEAVALYNFADRDGLLKTLRERGLIAPEPDCDDVLLDEAERQAKTMFQTTDKSYAREVAWRFYTLKRGLELAKPALTREEFDAAAKQAGIWFSGAKSANRFYAALTEPTDEG